MTPVSLVLDLAKGQNFDLRKDNATLNLVKFGLGWAQADPNAPTADLDAFAVALHEGRSVIAPDDVLYFRSNKRRGAAGDEWVDPARPFLFILDGAVTHSGDELTGAADGDDETISVYLDKLPADVNKIVFYVNIFDAVNKKQNFGQIKDAGIRVYDGTDSNNTTPMAHFDLTEDFSAYTAVSPGYIYRYQNTWKFKALGKGTNGTISEIAVAASTFIG